MTEKRVFVRLAARGGKKVEAELKGIGETGEKGFRKVSREVDLANAKLAAFGRKAQLAAKAAMAAVTAAGAAMVRNGLQVVDAQAKLAQSLRTTVESIQVLDRAADLSGARFSEVEGGATRLTRRLSLFAENGGGPAAKAIERLNLNAAALLALPIDKRIAAVSAAIRDNATASEQAALFSQLFGDRAFVAMQRVDSATLRQATQDVRDFGVVVSEADAEQIEVTNDALSRLGLIWRGLSNKLAVAAAPSLEAVANALAALAKTTGPLGKAITMLFDNMGRLASTALALAGLMAGRWVAGMLAAVASTVRLTGALTVLRGALLRTGIGALIVGAGELIYQFTRLVSKAGGFGEALDLLKDVAVEAWDRMQASAAAAWARIDARWAALQASIFDGLQAALSTVTQWANSTVGAFVGAFEAVKATWKELPRALGDFAFQAANGLIAGVEAMINSVVRRINGFIADLNGALALLPDWATGDGGLRIGTVGEVSLGGVTNPFAGAAAQAGQAAGEAFRAAIGQRYVETPDLFTGMSEAARSRSAEYAEAADRIATAANRPMTAWQRLKDLVTGSGDEAATAMEGAAIATERLDDTLTEAADAANKAGAASTSAGQASADAAKAAATGWAAVVEKISDYAKETRKVGADIGSALVSAFSSAEDAIVSFVKTGKLSFRDLTISLIADLARIGARRYILGPLSHALGSSLGNLGSVFAGVFHQGGLVGAPAPLRPVPVSAFAQAPRLHSGGQIGLRSDEVPAILQRGERVLSRREAASYGAGSTAPVVNVTIQTRDAESFRQSRTQIAADISRAVAMGRRNL